KTGESLTDTLLVHSVDGTEQQVTVTINGTDDKAVIAGTSTATLTEDKDVHSGLLRVDGALTITDIDNGQNQFVADSYQGNYGYLSINQLGHWVYTANNNSAAIQGLKAGATLTETLYVHAIDGTEKVLKININGTEDKAIISGISIVSLVEDKNLHAGFLHADGMLAVKDADIGDNQFQANASQGLFGELTINNNGHWTYTADNNQPAINQLKTGESLIDTIVVKSIDGSEHQIKIIINGQDDKAVISGSSTLDVTEDKNLFQGQLRADGQLNVSDPDLGEAQFIAGTLTGQYGHFTIDPSGAWTYTSDNKQTAIQSLNAGHEITDTVIIKTADGTEQTLCVHIHGTNDNAVISGTNNGVISNTYGAPNILYANGQLHITDVDTGEAHFQSQVIAGAYGSFLTIKPNGEWQYAVDHYNANVIKLPHGQQLTESFTVKSIDGTEHTISTTIVGDNTPAIITGTDVALFKEDGTKQTATGQLNILDPNTGDEHFKPETLQGKYGELHIDDKGLWHYALNNQGVAVQSLKSGETVDDLFFIKGHDGTPHGIQIQILGTNDLANINGVDAGVVVEDTLSSGLLITKGQLTITDIDSGQDLFPSGLQQGQYGQLVISNNGQWQYIANNNQPQIQQLSQTEALKEVFVVHSIDGTGHKIEVNIHGSNDIAKITGDTSAVLQEDTHNHQGNLVAQGQLVATDIDHGESQFIVDVNHAAYGQFSINNNGHWQYVVDNNSPNIQALTSKDTLKDTIIVRTVDGTEKSITVTINGSDDKAIIGGVDTGDVTEGTAGQDMSPDYAQPGMSLLGRSPLYVSGALTITDLDAGEATFDSRGLGFNYTGKYGDLMLREDGTWSYYADAGNIRIKGGHTTNRGTAIDQLGKGEALTDTVTIYSKDGTAHDIVITIHGSNDRPYCSSEVTLNAGTEDTRQTITAAQLLSNTIDVDNNDAGLLTIENLHADHGSIKHNKDGSFSFTPEKDYNGQVHFTYDVKDGHGGVTHTSASTTLSAVNDNPDVTPITDTLTEDTDKQYQVNLLGSATDVDGDALSISQILASFEGSSGALPQGVTVANDGHSLIIDSHAQVFQHLGVGEKADIVVHYMIDDNHGGQTPAVATITMVGADDKATLAANVIQMTETQALDSAQHGYGGKLQLVDPDTGDNTQFAFSGQYIGQGYAPGNLTVWPDGSYQFRLEGALNRHADDLVASLHAGESKQFPYEIKTSDGQTLTIMVKVTGEDNNAQIHVSMPNMLPASQHITEENFVPASVTNLYAGGRLQVVDPDHDQSYLQAETINTAHNGQFKISADGGWNYTIDNSIDEVQKLGAGESFTETHTVHSLDGTASQLLTVTVHGTNDAPVVSAAVKLAPGIEDTDIQLNKSELLANTTDVDHNDIGQLDVANLVADHGTVIDNKDGTFSFVPEKDYNGAVQFNYDIKDAHGGVTHTQAGLTLTASQDAATFSGDSTGDVHEGHSFTAADGTVTNGSVGDRSPDHQHGNIGKLWNDQIHTDGHLNINDADSGEAHAQTGIYHGNYGQIILQTNGDWSYYASIGQDSTGRTIDKLGQGQSLTDTVTIKSADGTTHDIVVTIHGDNDRPYCSSAVTLHSWTEDNKITLTATDLLANTIDVDTNDAGKLSIENLQADHGVIAINADGDFVFTPEQDYNGQVQFTYDVKDGHGGITHTGATTTLAAVGDAATFSGTDSGAIKEDRHVQGDADQSVAVSGVLNVKDPDANESEFVASRNVHAVSDPLHGHLSIGRAGDWTYSVPNANLNHLAEGETVQVTYQVHSRGGDTHNITVDVVGTNDAPSINVHTLVHGSEDISYQMQASQFGFTDVDNKDALHSVSITDLPDPLQGKFMLDGQAISANQVIAAGDISKLQFVPTHNFNGDVNFSYTVNDGHADSTKATNTLHISPVNDAATIDGQTQSSTSASITEDSATSVISGQLTLVDPDAGEDKFASNTQISGQYGQLTVDQDGSWHYALNNASPLVNMLNAGQQLTDTITVTSPDGTASQTIAITIHGHSDTPSLQLQEAGATQGLDLFAGIQGNGIIQLQYSTDGVTFSSQVPAGFSLAADGHTLEVDPANAAYDHLANGAQHKIWVNYQLQEGAGSSAHQSSQQAEVVIVGTSDKPIIHGFNANSAQFSGPVTGNLLQGATDVDDGAQLVLQDLQFKDPTTHQYVTVHVGKGEDIKGVGHISIASNGDYTFTPDPNFSGDAPGFIYRVVDTHGDYQDNSQNMLDIHINANHQPRVQTFTASTAEDTDFQFTAASFGYQDSDSDAFDHLSINQLPDPATGSLWLNGHAVTQGQAISANDIDTLIFKPAANFNGDAHFSYVASDGHQDSAAHTAVLTVTAVNDLPVLTINQTSHTQGNLVATDVDKGDVLSFSAPLVTGQFGSLSIDPDSGAYIYTQNNSVAQMNYNPATSTYSGVDVFEVQVSDHHGGVASKFISFSAEATVSSTTAGTLIISSSVPNQPLVSNTIPAGNIVVTPPANHVSIDLSSTSDSGSSNHDDLTNDTTPTITGHTDIPFSKVTIYDGNTPVGHALSNASGDFNATLSSLAEGLHNLSAKALAPSSILPAVSSVLDIEIDTQASATIQLDPITSDNVINAQESGADISVTGQVSGDVHQGDSVSLIVGQHSYSATVDASGHFNVNIAGTELASSSSITASVITTDSAGNSASSSQVMHYSSDTQVGMPTITFENPGSDNAYSKAEIAQGHAGTVTATVHAAADAQVGEHLSINGVDHVLDANSLAHGIDLEVAPSSIVRAIMTDEHGNVNSALNIAASAKPEPIVVTAPPGSHQIGASLGVPTLIPTQTPVPTAQQGWKILVNGHYQTSYTSQWGTLTINPKTGQLNYQEHANTHTGPHGSATNVGVHEDKFEVALQGSHHDDVIMHVQVSILSRGPGHSGKLTLGSEVLDMTVTPTFSHPAPPPPPLAADAHDIPQSDAIAEVSIDLNAVVIDGTDNNTEPDAFNQDSAEQFDTKQENTEQPSNDVSAHAEPEPVLTSQPPATTTMSATASAPIDHYLQMVGLSHDEIKPDIGIPDLAGLPTMHELNTADPQADMLDTVEVDAFENPLDDEHKEHPQHADHDAASVIDAPTEQSDINQDNDDDMLHQALNDMHNQF
ncbi:VCBS domain-containing protein, partial [Shewanella sp. P1-14-1]|uniref:VCBS domain-containing protein n=1 Tax=Shewanella sp. P1-14-1 TaxID=1723761 RepID=UPI0006D661E0